MVNIAKFFDNAIESIDEFSDDLGELLDFGFGGSDVPGETFDPSGPLFKTGRVNPEVDLTELERANPTNTNFPNPLGVSTPLLVGGGIVLSLIALKVFKVI